MVTQVDARYRAHRALAGYRASQSMRGNSNAHGALHDGQQLTPANAESWKRT